MEDFVQRDATRNQSAVDYTHHRVFIRNNTFQPGTFKNTGAGVYNLVNAVPVVRNAGTAESASMAFSATPMSAGQTISIAGLTFTSTGATTQAQAAAAFANLSDGATTGGGTAQGTYSGTLTGYNTGAVVSNAVVFTASSTGNKTNLAATGTAALPTATITPGTDGAEDGVVAANINTIKDVIGLTFMDCSMEIAANETLNINFGTGGWVDETKIVLPAGMTLDTVPTGSTKTVRDLLNGIGFNLMPSVDNTKHDN